MGGKDSNSGLEKRERERERGREDDSGRSITRLYCRPQRCRLSCFAGLNERGVAEMPPKQIQMVQERRRDSSMGDRTNGGHALFCTYRRPWKMNRVSKTCQQAKRMLQTSGSVAPDANLFRMRGKEVSGMTSFCYGFRLEINSLSRKKRRTQHWLPVSSSVTALDKPTGTREWHPGWRRRRHKRFVSRNESLALFLHSCTSLQTHLLENIARKPYSFTSKQTTAM